MFDDSTRRAHRAWARLPHRGRSASGVAALLVALVGAGCGGKAHESSVGGLDGGSGAGGDDAASETVGGAEGGFFVEGGIDVGTPPVGTGCSVASQYIYVLAADNTLSSFDPPTLTFTTIGVLDCPASLGATPFSMAVDRFDHGWSVFTDGNLYRFDVKTAKCTGTGFRPGQSGFTTFGMGFSTDAPGGTSEHLFVSGDGLGLATIDTTSLALTPIANYDALGSRAELTGTGDARLFGAFEGTPYVVAGIDKATAHITSQAPQTPISYPPDSSNFAFAFWGGDFWLFVGPGTSTDVFHYQVASGTTTKVKSIDQEIVGAGVSTCAPITPR
jgi:hypothetical protein